MESFQSPAHGDGSGRGAVTMPSAQTGDDPGGLGEASGEVGFSLRAIHAADAKPLDGTRDEMPSTLPQDVACNTLPCVFTRLDLPTQALPLSRCQSDITCGQGVVSAAGVIGGTCGKLAYSPTERRSGRGLPPTQPHTPHNDREPDRLYPAAWKSSLTPI